MKALRTDPKDNVAVITESVAAGDTVRVSDGSVLTAAEAIETGHKIALDDIPAGEMVIKYGVPIGQTSENIEKGAFVHTHNLQDITTMLCDEYVKEFKKKVTCNE